MVLSMQRWSGKVAIVTGASAGIGAAISKNLVENGLKVIGVARNLKRLEQLVKDCEGHQGQFVPFQADISKEENIMKVFEYVKSFGPVHILINNAGICKKSSLAEGETKDWRDILDVNVLGLSIATSEPIKSMRNNGIDGHIVHINSILGHEITTLCNMYGGSKFAVTALTETLRQELVSANSKIKITSISPGLVRTSFVATAHGEDSERALRVRQAPAIEPEDVADAVQFVLSTPSHVQVHELVVQPLGQQRI